MKRFALLLGVLACVGILATSHLSFADGDDDDQVTICHVIRHFERPNGIVFFVGHVISVNEDAYESHHENHGDVLLSEIDANMFNGGQCCSFSVLPDGTIVPGQVD